MTATADAVADEGATAPGAADRISRIEVTLFSYPMVGVEPGGADMPGATSNRRRIAVRMLTRGGAEGA